MEQTIHLRVICLIPPCPDEYGAAFGLQDNSTTKEWVIHAGKLQSNGDVHFEFACRVKPHPKTGAPSFLGDFVHGDSAKRFVYLSWRPAGWRPGQPEPPGVCVRRMKIHLSSITWKQIETAQKSAGLLEATVAGRGRDGGPNCASVPLLGEGWRVKPQ